MKIEIGQYKSDGVSRNISIDIIDDDLYDLRHTLAIIIYALLKEFLIASPVIVSGIPDILNAFQKIIDDETIKKDDKKIIKKGLKKFYKKFLNLWW
jgi:hypothetical protein